MINVDKVLFLVLIYITMCWQSDDDVDKMLFLAYYVKGHYRWPASSTPTIIHVGL